MCPTLTVGVFLLALGPLFCSFVQQLELWRFKTLETSEARPKRKEKTKHVQNLENTLRIPLSPTFFRHYAIFFDFFCFNKGSPLQFLIFPPLPILSFSGTFSRVPLLLFRYCDTSKISFHFLKIFPKGSPFHTLQQTGVSKSTKGPPFYNF